MWLTWFLTEVGLRPADAMAQNRTNLQSYRGVRQRQVPEHEAEGFGGQQVRQLS